MLRKGLISAAAIIAPSWSQRRRLLRRRPTATRSPQRGLDDPPWGGGGVREGLDDPPERPNNTDSTLHGQPARSTERLARRGQKQGVWQLATTAREACCVAASVRHGAGTRGDKPGWHLHKEHSARSSFTKRWHRATSLTSCVSKLASADLRESQRSRESHISEGNAAGKGRQAR
eukprot:1218694-Prymnesium_polylepis.1